MGFYDAPPAENPEDHLEVLRSQRQLLFMLSEEISAARRRMAVLDPSEFWSSESQRAFQLGLAEVIQDIDHVLHQLDDARASVRGQIRFAEGMR